MQRNSTEKISISAIAEYRTEMSKNRKKKTFIPVGVISGDTNYHGFVDLFWRKGWNEVQHYLCNIENKHSVWKKRTFSFDIWFDSWNKNIPSSWIQTKNELETTWFCKTNSRVCLWSLYLSWWIDFVKKYTVYKTNWFVHQTMSQLDLKTPQLMIEGITNLGLFKSDNV